MPTLNFPLPDGPYKYRPLRQATLGQPVCKGWDVYAFQSGLLGASYKLPKYGADGHLGDESNKAIRLFQTDANLTVDGIAGIVTQRALLLVFTVPAFSSLGIPRNLISGQVEYECGYQVGNHTALYSDGGRDIGCTQQHDKILSPETLANRFLVPESVHELAAFIVARFNKYWQDGKNPHVTTRRRAWELASGAWNRPAWTDTLARGGKITKEQSDWIENYIAHTTAYVIW